MLSVGLSWAGSVFRALRACTTKMGDGRNRIRDVYRWPIGLADSGEWMDGPVRVTTSLLFHSLSLSLQCSQYPRQGPPDHWSDTSQQHST